jgi:hypothetical protein
MTKRLDITGRDPTIASERGKIEPWLDVDVVDFGVFIGDQYQNVAEQCSSRALPGIAATYAQSEVL